MVFNKKELAKLSPEQRIKKLKEIEEQNKKEKEEIEKLITQSKSDAETELVESRIKLPETKPVNIDELFAAPASLLEQKAKEELSAEEEKQIKYQVAESYEALKEAAYGGEEERQNLLEKVDQIGERLEKAKYVSISEETNRMVTASQSVIHKLRRFANLDYGGKRYS